MSFQKVGLITVGLIAWAFVLTFYILPRHEVTYPSWHPLAGRTYSAPNPYSIHIWAITGLPIAFYLTRDVKAVLLAGLLAFIVGIMIFWGTNFV
jgi:hypothetical protein